MITPGSALTIASILMIIHGAEKGTFALTAIGFAVLVFTTALEILSNKEITPPPHFPTSDVENVFAAYSKSLEEGRPRDSK